MPSVFQSVRGMVSIPSWIDTVVFCDCVSKKWRSLHLHNTPGLTETSPVIALNVLSRRKAGSVGQVLKGVDVWIVDSEGKALGPGQEGEICCRYFFFFVE